jgi:hypothetical protein
MRKSPPIFTPKGVKLERQHGKFHIEETIPYDEPHTEGGVTTTFS